MFQAQATTLHRYLNTLRQVPRQDPQRRQVVLVWCRVKLINSWNCELLDDLLNMILQLNGARPKRRRNVYVGNAVAQSRRSTTPMEAGRLVNRLNFTYIVSLLKKDRG